MKQANKLLPSLILLVCTFTFFLSGCGNNKSLPDGFVIEITPTSSNSLNNPGVDTVVTFKVVVRDQEGMPAPYARFHITGNKAEPAIGARYQFYYYPDGVTGLVPSGFEAQTDKYGVYNFSIVVFNGDSFTDSIFVNSGTAVESVTITLTTTG